MKYCAFIFILIFSNTAIAQTFSSTDFTIPGAVIRFVDWADYDNDSDLDLLVEASTTKGNLTFDSVYLFRNDAGKYQTRVFAMPTVLGDRFAWEDFDNDNDLDFIIVTISTVYSLDDGASGIRMHENKGNGQFVRRRINIPYYSTSHWAWHDFDNDGDLDFFYSGYSENAFQSFSGIWRNDGNDVFVLGASFGAIQMNTFVIGDFNNDGFDDIIGTTGSQIKIFSNKRKMVFSSSSTSMQYIYDGSLSLTDYNDDGFLDVVVCGNTDGMYNGVGSAKIYKNTGTSFTEIQTIFTKMNNGFASSADFDNDGDLDILITGRDSANNNSTRLYRNDGNDQFSFISISLPQIARQNSSIGDFDNDHDLDIVLTGIQNFDGAKILKNDIAKANTVPSPPTGGHAFASGDSIIFSWNSGTDTETPASGLTYSLWIGNSPNKSSVLSPSAVIATGWRFSARSGNAGTKRTTVIHNVPNGTYYWGVQSVDNGFAGSVFSAVESVSVSTSNLEKYSDANAAITGIAFGMSVWGDYDGDGDLDVVVTGQTAANKKMTSIYRNDDGTFVDIKAGLIPLSSSMATWGDMDNDGDLDLAVSGFSDKNIGEARIYRNDGNNVFTDTKTLSYGFTYGSIRWGDYDNDGLLDLFIGGATDATSYGYIQLFRNLGSGLFKSVKLFSGFGMNEESSVALGDYDADGDLDFAFGNGRRSYVTRIYRNDGKNIFTEYGTNFTETKDWNQAGPVLWHDVDMDGDLDLLAERTFFKNTNGSFTQSTVLAMPEVGTHSSWMGDVDNDGDPDILISGIVSGQSRPAVRRFINNGGNTFTAAEASFTPAYVGSISGGDYDNDGDMDVMLSGYRETGPNSCNIYNRVGRTNTKPDSPKQLTSTVKNGVVKMSWQAGFDAETPASGLGYNVYIGSSPNTQNIRSAQAHLATGYRYLPEPGNTQSNLFSLFVTYVGGTYYWSVQTVDQSFEGSSFSPVQSFQVEAIPSPGVKEVNFGSVEKGITKVLEFSIVNKGNIPLTLRLLNVDDTSFSFTKSIDTVAAGDSGIFAIQFRSEKAGAHTTQLFIQHNGTDGILSIPLSATSGPLSAASDKAKRIPKEFAILQNYPNPFNLGTQFEISVSAESHVKLTIYDQLGREIATIFDEVAPVGFHLFRWNAEHVATGMYFCRMESVSGIAIKKFILLK